MMLAEEPGHKKINIKVNHILFRITEYGAHIFGDIFDFSSFINQVNEYGSKLRTEDVDLFFVKDSFFEQLMIIDFFKFSLITLVNFDIIVKEMNHDGDF